jgi:outer membrane protein assembly complex protein YaeT
VARWAVAPLALLGGLALAGAPCTAWAQPPALPAAPPVEKDIVSDVIIQGTRLVPVENIKNQLKTHVGKEYVPEVLQEDVRSLYATRQFGNVYADARKDGHKVTVYVYLKDFASIVQKVSFKGNVSFSDDDLDKVANIRKGMPLNPVANKVACNAIRTRYFEEGRPYASCDLLKGGEVGDTEVIFNIYEGPKVRVRSIAFTGNTFVSSAVLNTHVNSSTMPLGLPIGGTYNPMMADNDVYELMKYYRSFGYHDVRVNRELVYTGDGREVTLVFHISEGVRYRLADAPHVEGVKSVPAETLEALVKTKGNEYVDENKMKKETAAIQNYIGYGGVQTRVRAETVWPEDKSGIAVVNYQVVEEKPPARVGQIYVVGNERTKMNVILRQLPLYPGQVLTYPDLQQAERNLARLNIFDATPDGATKPTVKVLDNPLDPDNPVKDILVTVQEANTGSLMFGVGVNSDSGLTGSIVLNERNFDLFRPPVSFDDLINGTAFRGAGQELRIEAVPGTQLQRYSATFREPFLFDSPFSLTVSGYYYERLYNEYTEYRVGGRFTLGRKVSDFWSLVGTIRIEEVNVGDVGAGAPVDYTSQIGGHFQTGFRVGATRDSRDSVMRATEGSLFNVGFEEVVGDHVFSLANIDFTKYWTLFQRADGSGRQVLVMHNEVDVASDNTPVYERFFAGGFRSIRGFQFRGVGPSINGFMVGGDFMLLNSLEYQIPVRANDQIYFVTFVDTGTVSERADRIDDYRVSVGFGVRFVVPMLGPVPIALDFGFPVVRGPNDLQQVFNFFMGFSR